MGKCLLEVGVVRRKGPRRPHGSEGKGRGRSYENSANIVFQCQVRAGEPGSLYISLSVWGQLSKVSFVGTFSRPFKKNDPEPRKPALPQIPWISLRLLSPVVTVGYCRDVPTGEGSALTWRAPPSLSSPPRLLT